MIKKMSMDGLARLAGVSRTTVSLALRNHPSISEARREQITALANQHGYTVDPELSKLARAIHCRSTKNPPTIACLIFEESTESGRYAPYATRFYATLKDKVQRKGFRLDEFHIHRDTISPLALRRILMARGIKGLIVGAHKPSEPFLKEFNFSGFSCSCPQVDQTSGGIPSAGSNQFYNTLLALEKTMINGYHRPGMIFLSFNHEQNWHWMEGAYYFFIKRNQLKLIPPLFLSEWSGQVAVDWIEKHHPDVLLSSPSHTQELLHQAGLSVPDDIAYVALNLQDPDNTLIAGIDDRKSVRIEAMVDLVIDQMNRNVCGLQVDPVRIFISGKWVDGSSLPKITGSDTAKKIVQKSEFLIAGGTL